MDIDAETDLAERVQELEEGVRHLMEMIDALLVDLSERRREAIKNAKH